MKKVKNVFTSDERFPLFEPYGPNGQTNSWISLDLNNGDIDAGYNRCGLISVDHWNKIIIEVPISSQSTSDFINNFINENIYHLQLIFNNSSIEWDGRNWRGKLNDTAQAVYDNLINIEFDYEPEDQTHVIDDLAEWLQETPAIETTFDDLISDVLSYDGDDGYYFSDSLNNPGAIETAILEMFANDLYNDIDISKKQAIELIKSGICDDSAWTDELQHFAKLNKSD